MKTCYYQILEIDRSAQESEIKAAYRKKAFEYHPDRNTSPKAEDLFKEASEAYEVLSDPQKRAIYDQYGHEGLDRQGMHHGYGNMNDIFSHFGDLFEDFFGMGRRQRSRSAGPRHGRDLHYELSLSFEEAYQGVEKELRVPRQKTCHLCEGRGYPKDAQVKTCSTCGGRGQVVQSQGFFTLSTTCPSCGGQGQTVEKSCEECLGRGRLQEIKNLKVKVPAGVDHGMQICLRGEGEEGRLGGSPGDLYVVLRVAESKDFRREGQDLWIKKTINVAQAALGIHLKVKGPSGEDLDLEVPPGVQSGEVLGLKKQGMPGVGREKHGDLKVEILVKVPSRLSKKQKELFKELEKTLEEKDSSLSKKLKNKLGL
ncbi:MAG: molecular chaperone DnaJ [Deltaproteobacteria bacterium]|nr:molecular chaperone DnaJ [Deltaproteobacteria bacterium]